MTEPDFTPSMSQSITWLLQGDPPSPKEDWLPISTTPADGTVFLVVSNLFLKPHFAGWSKEKEMFFVLRDSPEYHQNLTETEFTHWCRTPSATKLLDSREIPGQ